MSASVRDQFQQTAMQVHVMGDIDKAIITGVQRTSRTLAVATAVGIAAVVLLAALILSNPLGVQPEPLQPPTPAPTPSSDVYGWPDTNRNPPGVYSLDNKMCGSNGGFCNVGWIHNGYGASNIQILIMADPKGATADVDSSGGSLYDGVSAMVAGVDGTYRRIDARQEQWTVEIEGTTIVIELKAEPGASSADLAEAHAIIASIRTEPTDNVLNTLGFKLVFTLESNDWDSG